MFKDKLKPMKGFVEIFDEKGNKIREAHNLIMGTTRIAMLYNIFRDQKILDEAASIDPPLIKTPSTHNDKVPIICGFMFGNNGADVSNPASLRVPSPIDTFIDPTKNLSNTNPGLFRPVPFISVAEAGDTSLINSGGSYTDIKQFINNPSVSTDVIKNNDTNSISYFTPDEFESDGNYYCKAISTSNSEFKIDSENCEFEYILRLNVEPFDLIGKSFNEIGLVLAFCNTGAGGQISDIDTSTINLASRLTFDEISLSRTLLSSFTIKYHIYF